MAAVAVLAVVASINIASAERGGDIPPVLREYLQAKAQKMMANPKVAAIVGRGTSSNGPCEAEWTALTLADADLYTAQATYDIAEDDYNQCMGNRVPGVRPNEPLDPIPTDIE